VVPKVVLQDRYRLDGRIAAGGVGEVWRSTDLALDRQVAVKLLRPEHASDEVGITRFRAEAHHAGRLSHPNIARVYDYCEARPPDPGYLVMEFVDGPSLARMLDSGPLDPAQTMDIIAQAARGLAAAHGVGVVHWDVKPGNLLVSADGMVKITDFGISQAVGSEPVTRPGGLIGTPAYLAPERGAGCAATPAADLYALGVVAYHCLSGRLPFEGEPLAVVIAHMERDMPPLPASVPPGVAALVADLTSKDPRARPESAAAVAIRAEYLRAALTGPAVAGREVTGAGRPAAAAALALTAAPGAAPARAAGEAAAGPAWNARQLNSRQPGGRHPAGRESRGARQSRRRGTRPARAGLALVAAGAASVMSWMLIAARPALPARPATVQPTASQHTSPAHSQDRTPTAAKRLTGDTPGRAGAGPRPDQAHVTRRTTSARPAPSPASAAPSATGSAASTTPVPSPTVTPSASSAAPTPSVTPTPSESGDAPSPITGSASPVTTSPTTSPDVALTAQR
jgi:eukaryotic-like serine/threonine-protein kinase